MPVAVLGTASGAVVAAEIGQTVNAVRVLRDRVGIADPAGQPGASGAAAVGTQPLTRPGGCGGPR